MCFLRGIPGTYLRVPLLFTPPLLIYSIIPVHKKGKEKMALLHTAIDVLANLPPSLTRYFCTTCGTPNFVHVKSEGWWCCFAGIIERDLDQMSSKEEEWVKDIVKIGEHDFVAGTVDGGIAARMLKLGGDGSGRRDVSCFAKRSCYSDHRDKTEPELMRPEDVLAMQATVEKETAAAVAPAAKDDMMTAKCHCGGVDLRVKRANFNEDKQGLSERFTEAGDRYIAQFCACRSCRLQSAVSLQPWTYIPPQNFSVAATGKPVVFGREACKEGENANEGTTLKHYWSSTDVCRSFCGRCGASFFYWCDERPEVVDLSMGVVRGSSGVMAREWVSWRWRVSWGEECVDAEVMEAVLGKGEE